MYVIYLVTISPYFLDGLFSLKDIDCVENIRGYGLMGGIDIKKSDRPGKAGFLTYKIQTHVTSLPTNDIDAKIRYDNDHCSAL